MDTGTTLRRLEKSPRLSLSHEELTEFLAAVTILREEDTCISGMLRILLLGNDTVLVQEETPRREALVRVRPSLQAAEDFVRKRLEIYERMWDGCGCKVDYEES